MATATSARVAGQTGTRTRFCLLIGSLLIIVFNRSLIPSIKFDWLNVIPLAAAIYVGYCLVALEKTCGHMVYVRRCLSADPSVPKPRGAFLFSPWLRSMLVLAVAVVALEFSLRCLSYHRSLVYERQGDLLFTPSPNQDYVEKISLTYSHINSYGLRGGPVDTRPGKEVVLCLGDSITYGYGVDDAHTYPALLQATFERKYPGRYVVLDAGVDAYPLAFEDQKFLYLWNRGLHPKVVFVGYSMNEGWLGHLVDSSEEVKRQFARRVWLKDHVRSFALYNLVVENWARDYYDRMKGKLVPGTNFAALPREELDNRYEAQLWRMLNDLRTRHVTPIFMLFCSFNRRTGRYDCEGPLQKKFADFAQKNGIRLLRSDDILRGGEPADVNLVKYFIDEVHMNELGTEKVAEKLAVFVPSAVDAQSRTPVIPRS
jgi:lysophospholipase L1-like esterase